MSTNIDIKLVGGELLGRDAAHRSNQRNSQHQREKDAKTEKEFVDSAVKRVLPMKGEQGQALKSKLVPAAFPSTGVYSIALAFFNRPLGNSPGNFRISTTSGASVSWDAEDLGAGLPTPDNVNTPNLQRTGYTSGAGLTRNTYALILPINKSTCIACWVSGGLSAVQSSTFDRTRTVANRVEFSRAYNYYVPVTVVGGVSYGGFWRTRFTNCPFAEDNLSNVPNSYPSEPPSYYNFLDSSYSTYALSFNTVNSFNIQERNVLCALIKGNTIRKITTPSIFREKAIRLVDIAEANSATGDLLSANTSEQEDLELWWKLPDGSKATSGVSYARGSSADFIVSSPARDPDQIWDREPAGRSMFAVGYDYSLTGNSEPLYKQILTTTTTAAQYADSPDLNKMLGIHYGMGYETPSTDASHGVLQGFYTPAIYSYLNNNLPISNNSMRNYGFVRSQLSDAGANVPTKLIVQEAGGDLAAGLIRFHEAAIPSGLTIESDLSALSYTKQKTISYDASLGFPYVAWDWGRAAYNQAQLTSLGFSQSDLS